MQINTIKIGNQLWMADNVDQEMKNARYYNFNKKKYYAYSKLYTWEAAMKACPAGWHLPSKKEFRILLKSTKKKNLYKLLIQDSGYGATLAGFGIASSSKNINSEGYYWSSTSIGGSGAWCLQFNKFSESVKIIGSQQTMLYSVRCIKNDD